MAGEIQSILVSLVVIVMQIAVSLAMGGLDLSLLLIVDIAIIGIQLATYLLSSGLFCCPRTEKFYDLSGSVTYITAVVISAALSYKDINVRRVLITVLVCIWAVRLGGFLFIRIKNTGGSDARFEKFKSSAVTFLQVWAIQSLWVFFTLLSSLTIYLDPPTSLNIPNYVGIAIWAIGFVFEFVADYQKYTYKRKTSGLTSQPAAGFISSGLWSISRHPNYFGEIFLWIGISFLSVKRLEWYWGLLYLLISPIFVFILIVFISGVRMDEERKLERFEGNEAYEKYLKDTPALVPFIGRRGKVWF